VQFVSASSIACSEKSSTNTLFTEIWVNYQVACFTLICETDHANKITTTPPQLKIIQVDVVRGWKTVDALVPLMQETILPIEVIYVLDGAHVDHCTLLALMLTYFPGRKRLGEGNKYISSLGQRDIEHKVEEKQIR